MQNKNSGTNTIRMERPPSLYKRVASRICTRTVPVCGSDGLDTTSDELRGTFPMEIMLADLVVITERDSSELTEATDKD